MTTRSKWIAALLAILLIFWIDFLSTRPWSKAAPEIPVPTEAPTLVETSEEELIPITGDLTSPSPVSSATAAPSATQEPSRTPTQVKTATITPTAIPSLTPVPLNLLPVDRWREWPIMPSGVSQALRSAYQAAVAQGKIDPHAFSVFGDCQGEADAYLGVFDTSPGLVERMADDLKAYVAQFTGSFNRYNPAAKSGSSAGSLLYAPWNDNKEGKCTKGETPVDCELRVHRPSIVFIQLGTHFETPDRNSAYLTTIIKKVQATGAVPLLVTKGDNLEGNNFVNHNIAALAAQYDLPLWNFWAAIQELPGNGIEPDGMHLTKDGNTVHQMDALRVLGLVWESVQ